MKKILVIGATGMIGKPVTRVLLDAGLDITLMARNVPKAKSIFPNANIVYGDVFDPLSMLPVFEGKDIVYINLGPLRSARKSHRMTESEGIENIVSVAQKTDVKRLILLSSMVQNYNGMNGFHWWVFDIKHQAVSTIQKSGIPYTIFYASTFMESFDQLMMKGNNIMLAGESKAPMHFIAAKDYGKQLVRSIAQLNNENKEYFVQGPEAYNWDNAARIFIDNYKKRKLKTLKAPLGILKFMGKLSPVINYGARICEALNNYPEKMESEATWEELGKPETTVKRYAEGLSEEK
jgi:uncharacterized protein YbjT (DUF2867 family)